MEEKDLARTTFLKIQGWLPDSMEGLPAVADQLRFIGVSLSSPENVESMFFKDFCAAGDMVLNLAEEIRIVNSEYSQFIEKLCELKNP